MITVKQQIIETNAAHPDWTAKQVADHIGTARLYVQKVGWDCMLKFPPDVKGRPARSGTTGKVIAVNKENPHWTARQVADHLGISMTHVAGVGRRHGLTFMKARAAYDLHREAARTDAIAEARKVVAGFLGKPVTQTTVSQIMTALSEMESRA